MSGLASRMAVAAVLLPLLVGAVYLGGWWLLALALLGGLLALDELYRMARALRPLVLAGHVGLVLALLGLELGGVAWMLAGILGTLLVAFALYALADVRPSATASFGVTLLGVVWVGGGLGLLVGIRDLPEHGFWALIAVLFAVFAGDTAAFFVGRAIGRRKLAPAISPGKSWEGVLAGVAAAIVTTYLLLYRDRETFLSTPEMLALGAIVAVASVAGDLFESAIKRDLERKDSGRLLGGHGGMLDRLDSLLWAGPAAFFAILAFGHP